MREIIARAVCVLTVGVIVALSFLFAAAHNPQSAAQPLPEAAGPAVAMAEGEKPDRPTVIGSGPRDEKRDALLRDNARGRAVYEAQNCATCHSLAGEGNPRRPLDDVGARLTPDQLRAWTTGTGEAAAILSEAVVKRKQRYSSLPAEDLEALMAYLSTRTTAK